MTTSPSGIYKITNNKNGKVYIGQSQNMFLRRKQHFISLRYGHHENKLMQADWNRDSKGFRFDIVEYCSIDKLNEREKYWIEKYNSIESGYNQGWVPYKRKLTRNKIKGYRKRS